jgi:hypothetical protein
MDKKNKILFYNSYYFKKNIFQYKLFITFTNEIYRIGKKTFGTNLQTLAFIKKRI